VVETRSSTFLFQATLAGASFAARYPEPTEDAFLAVVFLALRYDLCVSKATKRMFPSTYLWLE
jgi:hypothetical protein